METKFKIRIISEGILYAESKNEADQIAEFILARESNPTIFGNVCFSYAEVEELGYGSRN